MKKQFTLVFITILLIAGNLFAQAESRQGKNPVIVIPGLMGSKLVNQTTKENVWIRFDEAESDDLKLPISPNLGANRDSLEATEILDQVRVIKFLPGISVYKDLMEYLEKKAGYRKADFDNPKPGDDQDTFFVFPYDWRRDNVEISRNLLSKIEKLKLKLKKPNLKFDVVGHSMGGIIARYAAMYGNSDLTEKPKPSWAGAKHFERIFMLGTPNEGSMSALDSLVYGVSVDAIAGRYFPGYLNKEVVFTMPSLFQLLPHGRSINILDEDLKPMTVDIYDSAVWEKFGWSITSNEKIMSKFSKSEKRDAEKYLEMILKRTKRFHDALDAKTVVPATLTFYVYGSECKKTLDAAILYKDSETKKWKMQLRGDSFKNSQGIKVAEKSVKDILFAAGDGTVSRRSLFAESVSEQIGKDLFSPEAGGTNRLLLCEGHTSLPGNKKMQESIGTILANSLAN